jgi:DNA-binding response OmpR family regulator
MYLQDGYCITTTTSIDAVKSFIAKKFFDVIICDIEPSPAVEDLCREIKAVNPLATIILTYVFKNQIKDCETKLRKYVNSIFYKPFDLNELSMKLSALVV